MPKDIRYGGPSSPPRELAERFFTVQRWTELPKGGHFTAWEVPDLLADNMRAFVGQLTPV